MILSSASRMKDLFEVYVQSERIEKAIVLGQFPVESDK